MIDKLIEILHRGNHSLVIDNGTIHTYDGRGVSDLYHIYTTEPQILNGSTLADKVIGKGAAALMILGGIKAVYADVISIPALNLLNDAHVTVDYSKLVPNIINRAGTGICPVEKLCEGCHTAADCLPLIKEFVNKQ